MDDAGFLSSKEDVETNVLHRESERELEHGGHGGGGGGEVKGAPWFEDMIKGSPLGRIRRRAGGQSSADGKTRIEWEIVEVEDVDEGDHIQGTGKRKFSEEPPK